MVDQIGRRLRIGVTVGNGKLVEREFSRLDGNITFGTHPNADIMISPTPGANLPKMQKLFSLTRVGWFPRRAIGYALMATSGMRGTLVEGDLKLLIAETLGIKAKRRIPFGIHTRGKIEIGPVKILFTMVRPRTTAKATPAQASAAAN